MTKKTFRGRVVLPGELSGTATVSRHPFNTSGSYTENMFAGRTDAAPCTDASNKELLGKDLSGMILCTTTTVGSTMGGMCLMGMKSIGVGPQALLFSNPIDTLAAAGVLMADIDRGVTNSNKARFYTRLRLYDDDALVRIAMTGEVPY